MRTYRQILLGHPVRSLKLRGVRLIEASYAPGTRFARHAHERANISLIIRGQLEECVERQTVQSTSLSVVLKPAGTYHSNTFGPSGARTFLVDLPHDAIGAANTWRWFDGGPVATAAVGLYLAFRNRCVDTEDRVVELLASVHEQISSNRCRAPTWLARVHDRLHSDEAASVVEIAAEFGVHPVYLARAFRSRYGCTITGLYGRLRVHRAANQIASTRTPLAHVAADSGFADQSHLTRFFKRDTGVTPAEFRRLASPIEV